MPFRLSILIQRTVPRIIAGFLILAASGCGRSEKGQNRPKKPAPPAASETTPESLSLSKRIAAFTGAPTKMVWARSAGSVADVYANYTKLQLWGIDTADGLGERPILSPTGNYSRPIITPDGNSILFTDKNTTRFDDVRKDFAPVVYRVDWDGTHMEKLGLGNAVDVWRDPDTKVDWVYVTDLLSTDRTSLFASKLERFQLFDPDHRELIWDKGQLSIDNIQLSRDGHLASGLFPWPQCGVMDLSAKTWRKNQEGCWPSLAPDDSGLSWVFDGAHKNLVMFGPGGQRRGLVSLGGAPRIGKHETYHPRWSNDVRFLAMTGPYDGATIGQATRDEIQTYIGKFNPGFDQIEAWIQVTSGPGGAYYPDLWIEGGENNSIDPSLAALEATTPPGDGTNPGPPSTQPPWLPNRDGILFAWENRRADNRATDARPCHVEAGEMARFGRFFEMLCDGGYFEADPDSNAVVSAYLSATPPSFSIEALVTAFQKEQNGMVMSHPMFQLIQRGGYWVFATRVPTPTEVALGSVDAGQPMHFAAVWDGVEWQAWRDGRIMGIFASLSADSWQATRETLTFGGKWRGSIESTAILSRAFNEGEIVEQAGRARALVAARKPVPRIRLLGRLKEMTADRPVEELDAYRNALLAYLYDVEEVIEGKYTEPQVSVLHWTIMNRVPLEGFPRRPGQVYELILEAVTDHPELESERSWNDLFENLPLYHDVATPQ